VLNVLFFASQHSELTLWVDLGFVPGTGQDISVLVLHRKVIGTPDSRKQQEE
jgi:hypothetical protein